MHCDTGNLDCFLCPALRIPHPLLDRRGPVGPRHNLSEVYPNLDRQDRPFPVPNHIRGTVHLHASMRVRMALRRGVRDTFNTAPISAIVRIRDQVVDATPELGGIVREVTNVSGDISGDCSI